MSYRIANLQQRSRIRVLRCLAPFVALWYLGSGGALPAQERPLLPPAAVADILSQPAPIQRSALADCLLLVALFDKQVDVADRAAVNTAYNRYTVWAEGLPENQLEFHYRECWAAPARP